jgi:hypothetical protein
MAGGTVDAIVGTVIIVTGAPASLSRSQAGILMSIIGGQRRRQRCSVWSWSASLNFIEPVLHGEQSK